MLLGDRKTRRGRRSGIRPFQKVAVTAAALLTQLPVLRDTMPVIPAPRDGATRKWRPVLFGLGAAVGFAVALQRVRREGEVAPERIGAGTDAPAHHSRIDLPRVPSIHLPAPLKESIEAELTTDGPLLFSPPDAIDPIGTEALVADDARPRDDE